MNTHAHVLIEQAAEESRHKTDLHGRPAASERPTASGVLQEAVPEAFFVPQAGPPVILLLGPWLLLVLLIIPPAAFLITLALVVAVGAGIGVALAALVASPYFLVRYLHARYPAWRHRFAAAFHSSTRRTARLARTGAVQTTHAKGTT
jgi:hypothetical protein